VVSTPNRLQIRLLPSESHPLEHQEGSSLAFSAAPPLLGNIKILPSIQNLINFITNTLPKPVLVALVYRLVILNLAFQILPTIGADSWETEVGVDDSWGDRPTSALAHLLLTYRQSIMIMVYSHLLCASLLSYLAWLLVTSTVPFDYSVGLLLPCLVEMDECLLHSVLVGSGADRQ